MHTLELLGELDRASTATLEAAIEDLCETEVAQIAIDLSRLTHIDATGVAVVAFRCRWCQRQGREVTLVPGSPEVQQAFEVAGLVERLPFLEHDRAASVRAIPTDTHAAVARARTGPHTERGALGSWRPRPVPLPGISRRRARARRARLAGWGL
jgi:anti-anti-sigma factor